MGSLKLEKHRGYRTLRVCRKLLLRKKSIARSKKPSPATVGVFWCLRNQRNHMNLRKH